MADHAKFVALAQRLIAKHGRSVTFKTLDAVTDASKPWRGSTGGTSTDLLTTLAVFVPHKGLDFGNDFIEDELMKSAVEICLVPGELADLTQAHLVHDGGQDYKVCWIRRLKPADLTLLYAIGVER